MNAKPTAYPILGHKHLKGDVRIRTEKIHRREITLRLSPPCEAEASEKYNKYKGDVNERNRGRDSNPQCPLRHPDFR